MIRIFGKTDTSFVSNGDVVIKPSRAKVKNELNGNCTLELECGIEYADVIENDRIVVVPTPEGDQAFRISKPVKTQHKISTKAKHVSFDAERYVIASCLITNSNCAGALASAKAACDQEPPLTLTSDIVDSHQITLIRKTLSEAIVGIAGIWGGEIKRDNYTVAVMSSIGQDRGVTIRYGKNMEGITATYDWSNVCTKVLPVGKDGITLSNVFLYSDTQYDVPYTKVVTFEQDIEKSNYPTENEYLQALKDDLTAKATKYLQDNATPKVNYNLSTIPIQEVRLGDTVEVQDEKLGINILTRVIAYEYDCITGKYTSLEYGNFTKKLSELMPSVDSKIASANVQTTQHITSNYEQAIATATAGIQQAMVSSYVIYEGNRILVVDTLPKENASNVILINSGGIAFSQTGINGTFTTVWNINGTFNAAAANFINLTADLIQGGTLTLGKGMNASGVLKLYDATDTLICEMNNTGFKMYGNDGSYIEINQQNGLVGYDTNGNRLYWVSQNVFHMAKAEVDNEITLAGKLRFIPMDVTVGGVHSVGIGLVALEE